MARFIPPASALAEQSAGQRFGLVALGILMTWGIADVWRTPMLVADQGGLGFFLLYMSLVGVVAMPAVAAGLSVGRAHMLPAPQSLSMALTGRVQSFYWLGLLMFVCLLTLAVIYLVVGSRVLAYAWWAATGQLNVSGPDTAAAALSRLLPEVWPQLGWLALLSLTLWLISSRQRRDVMRATGLLVPLLLILMGVMGVGIWKYADPAGGVAVLLAREATRVTPAMFALAGEQALLALGAGVAVFVTVGAYSRRRFPVGRALLTWALADGLLILLAGVLVLSLAFAEGMMPEVGGRLVFAQIPYFLSSFPLGSFYTVVVYIWLVLLVLGSLLALCEPLVYWIEHGGISRRVAALVVQALVWVLAVAWLNWEVHAPETVALATRAFSYLILPLPMLCLTGMVGYVRGYPQFCQGLGWPMSAWKSRLLWRMLRYLSFPLMVIILGLMILRWNSAPCWLDTNQVAACAQDGASAMHKAGE